MRLAEVLDRDVVMAVDLKLRRELNVRMPEWGRLTTPSGRSIDDASATS